LQPLWISISQVSLLSTSLAEKIASLGFTKRDNDVFGKIKKFNLSESSSKLFSFLNLHESCVAVFSAVVKSEGIDVENLFVKIPNIFLAFKTSFIYNTQCKKCDMSQKIDISDYNFSLPKIKRKCQSCQRVMNIDSSNLNPLTSIQKDDIIRFLNILSETGIFF